MTTILERPPEQITALELTNEPINVPTDKHELVRYPLHPFDEDPTELGLALKPYPAELTLDVKNLIKNIALVMHTRSLGHVAALQAYGAKNIETIVPRVVVVPNIIGVETMSLLAQQRRAQGLELEPNRDNVTTMKLVERK